MTGNRLLDWAILSISLFNAMLLAWLGLTVLLNSDRRRWGIWIAGGGMLLGSAFFNSHTALLGLGLVDLDWDALIFWWSAGLLSAITLPFLWYVIMLWYAGFWEDSFSQLKKRHRPWLVVMASLLLLGYMGIITATISLGVGSPRFGSWFLYLRFSEGGIPILVIGFSAYMLLCIVLSLDALRNPGPSARVMGSLARRRARPWLAAASITLLVIAVVVAAALFWVGQLLRQVLLAEVYQITVQTLARIDLLVLLLIGVVIVLLGQAIVSYEVFTGKTLPRRGLHRQWQRALIFAAVTSALVSAAVTLSVQPIYGLLLAALLMTLFFALVGWRTYVERERLMDSLRPFVASQGLYNRLLTPANPAGVDVTAPFAALCRDVLDTQRAFLVATGPLGALVENPLVYPSADLATLPALDPLISRIDMMQTQPIEVDPDRFSGAVWAIPLWSERGLNGVLLLGRKRGEGLYTQEEMEIAAITGERLVDTQASAEMSRRLMRLQREQMAQTQIVDQQTRRVLHDEILPDLHAAMIGLSSDPGDEIAVTDELLALLAGTHRQISDLLRELPAANTPEVDRLGLVSALRETLEREFSSSFDEIHWQVEGSISRQIDAIPNITAGVIYYAAREAIRNAAKHGRAPDSNRPLILTVSAGISGVQGINNTPDGEQLQLHIDDNGRGLANKVDEPEKGGHGLALHGTMMAIIGGSLSIGSTDLGHTTVTLTFPGAGYFA